MACLTFPVYNNSNDVITKFLWSCKNYQYNIVAMNNRESKLI